MYTPDDIKAWLKSSGTSRQQLADKLGVAKGTVNNWLSGTASIPGAKLELIRILIDTSENPATPQPPPPAYRSIGISLTSAEYSEIQRLAEGKPLDVFAREILLQLVRERN